MTRLTKITIIFSIFISLSAMTIAAENIQDITNNDNTEVAIYPNPVLGNEFNIKSDAGIVQVTVLNIVGQPVFKQAYFEESKIHVELETSERGLFLVQIETGDGSTSTKRILLK